MQSNFNFEELKEIQHNEIEALQAIFMEDYHEVVNKTAWKVKEYLRFVCIVSQEYRSLALIQNSYYTYVLWV